MVVYNFKGIAVVPSAKEFLDIVLSKTQRKTPTEIHKNYAISRIRAFYMRKVRFCQQSYHDRIDKILTEFPLLDDIHPFYADLINILYDRDHYKLALGQLNTAKHLIDNLGKDHVRLLKYGDSLYRCKALKRAGMGRMCTIVRRLGPSLAYLEQVRQHLARLPSIDPTTRTLIVCGYPNVGKSSFMNKVTRANVDVQPYAFTTKSLFVGHTDYRFIRWQVIDTPGILDHPLEERNTIEMQSITALAHLQAAILFVLDISELCGYTIKQQVSLFHSIKPLFAGKPLLVVLNKIDVIKPEQVHREDWALIETLSDPGQGGMPGTQVISMSTLTEEGVTAVKQKACDALLEMRVERKLKSNRGGIMSRVRVAMPVPRDNVDRPAVPNPAADDEMQDADATEKTETEKDKEGGERAHNLEKMQRLFEERWRAEQENEEKWARGEVPDMNSTLWQERYKLDNPEWRFDKIPEFLEGHNIVDFIDDDIEQMLEDLEHEEDERVAKLEEENATRDPGPQLDDEELRILNLIRKKKKLMQVDRNLNENSALTRKIKNKNQTFEDLQKHLEQNRQFADDQAADTVANIREHLTRESSRSQSRSGRKRLREVSRSRDASVSRVEKKLRSEDRSRSRLTSLTPAPGSGIKDLASAISLKKKARAAIRDRNLDGRKGEGDRVILNMKPKHLFAGKRGLGKTQRR